MMECMSTQDWQHVGGLLSSCVNSPSAWLDSDWVSINWFGEVQGQDTGSTANPSMKHQTSDDVDIAVRSEGRRTRTE